MGDTELPELTEEERKHMDEIPADAVSHWLRGERYDFKNKQWIAADAERIKENSQNDD